MKAEALPGSISAMGLKFDGMAADRHILDAIEFSKSLEGSSRLYRLVAHYCVHGEVMRPRTHSDLRCYTMPSEKGSHESLLVILTGLVHEIPAFADVYKKALDWLISKIMGFIKDKLSGQGNVNDLVETIKHRAERDAELNSILANGLIKANDNLAGLQERLIDTLPTLIAAAQPNLRKALTPLGSSCTKMTQFPELSEPVVVTEAEALAIRSDEELIVGKADYFTVTRFHSLSLDTGACRIELEGHTGLIHGKVDDIALTQPGNPYSSALNSHSALRVRAKPVYKDDELHKLFITESD